MIHRDSTPKQRLKKDKKPCHLLGKTMCRINNVCSFWLWYIHTIRVTDSACLGLSQHLLSMMDPFKIKAFCDDPLCEQSLN